MAATQAPQKKKRTKGGRYSHEITREEIELYYHLPCEEASRQLGIGLTILKRICRRLGIDKWPYRQLKRAGKLGEAAAANAAAAASGVVPIRGVAPPASAPAPRKRAPAKKKAPASAWEPREQSQGDDDDSSSQAGGASSSGSEGSWHAGHRGEASELAWQGSEPAAPAAPQPLPAGAPGRRRRSADGGRPPRAAADRADRSASPPTTSGSTGGATTSGGTTSFASGLQRAASGGLKRIREDEPEGGAAPDADPLMSLLDCTTDVDVAALSPFSAAAECFWGTPPAEQAGPAELAADMGRLAMRSMSLKRQCSRGDGGALGAGALDALDALDAAFVLETPVSQGMARAASMPAHRDAAAAQEQQHGQPPYGTQHQQHQQQQHLGEGIHDADALAPFALGDVNLSTLLIGASAPRHLPAASELPSASEGCMMPAHEAMAAAGVVPLHHSVSSGTLLDHSSSGSAQRQSASTGLVRDDSFPVGPAAGVTSVGPLAADDGAVHALLSPFSMGGQPEGDEDREVDDLLADFLSPAPSDLAEARMAELLGSFSPRASPRIPALDDAALAGIARAPRPPSAAAHAGLGAPAAGLRPGGASSRPSVAAPLGDPLLSSSAHPSPLSPLAPSGSGSAISQSTPTTSGTGAMQQLLASGGLDLPLGPSADLLPLVARLAADPSPAKQLMAGQLLQMQAQQAQQAAQASLRGVEEERRQRRLAAAGPGPAWGGAALSPREALSPSSGGDELAQAAAHHQHVAQQYLAQRQEVQAMLAQRGGSQDLGSLAGDSERLHQLARLKQLKSQLAAAQARQQELRRRREQLALARAAAGRATAAQQPASLAGGVSSAFGGGAGPRLGPPPPLPLHGGAQQRGGADGSAASLAAMLRQWRADAAWNPLLPGTEQRGARASSAPQWESPADWAATA